MSSFLSRVLAIDTRSRRQVERDIADEFAHHAACLRDRFQHDSVPDDQIEPRIAAAFGDARRHAGACRRIALKERIMLQRINLALLLLTIAAVAWVARGTDSAAEHSLAAIAKLTERVEALALAMPAPRAPAAPAADASADCVFIVGSVARPGVYNLPQVGLSLRKLLAASNFDPDLWKTPDAPLAIYRTAADRTVSLAFSATRGQITGDPLLDFDLKPGDRVEVPR